VQAGCGKREDAVAGADDDTGEPLSDGLPFDDLQQREVCSIRTGLHQSPGGVRPSEPSEKGSVVACRNHELVSRSGGHDCPIRTLDGSSIGKRETGRSRQVLGVDQVKGAARRSSRAWVETSDDVHEPNSTPSVL
jgi:hypothetical protein